jgi:hypothetical protein
MAFGVVFSGRSRSCIYGRGSALEWFTMEVGTFLGSSLKSFHPMLSPNFHVAVAISHAILVATIKD